MAIAFRNAGTASAATATTTTTWNKPSGVAVGDFLLWVITGNVNTAPATPTGWTVFATAAGSTTRMIAPFYRIADGTEPATYSATVSSGKWVSLALAYVGVNTDTPADATATTTITATAPAITTVTAGAWVLPLGEELTASGITTATWTSSGTVRTSATTALGSSTNVTAGMADQIQATAGSATPTLTASGTNSSQSRMTVALRPVLAKPRTLTVLQAAQRASVY